MEKLIEKTKVRRIGKRIRNKVYKKVEKMYMGKLIEKF